MSVTDQKTRSTVVLMAVPGGVDEQTRALDRLKKACPGGIRVGESMANHTTIGTGGRARFFAVPKNPGEVVALVRVALKLGITYIGIGRGSNLLVRDGGFNGLVIKVADNMRGLRLFSRTAHAEAGVSFTRLGRTLTREGRPGFEFAVGIPGSVGGAVRMNAGAFGRDVARVLKIATVVDGEGRVIRFTPDDLGFGYRHSALPPGAIVLSVIFDCPPGRIDEDALRRSQNRRETQPLAQKSFGSAFKNPEGGFAGKMIEECGLKGTRRGGVMISEKHANFLLNVGENTKANDIEDLVKLIIERVKDRFGVQLTPEVMIIGDR